jgi:hypothetical protein
MEVITQYKEAIKAKYEVAKNGVNSDYLLKPSPAKLRDLCCLLFEKGLNADDIEIFNRFFRFSDTEDKIRQIKKFEIDKFKPIRKFFLRESDLTNIVSINLAAVMVDFQLRPFLRFKDEELLPEGISDTKPRQYTPTDFIISNRIKQEEEEEEEEKEPEKHPAEVKPNVKPNKPIAKYIIILFFIGLIIYIAGTICFPAKNCMVWKGNHYEVAKPDIGNIWSSYAAYDENILKYMRKIPVCDTTTFFRNGKPIIWYSKQGNELEYFTYPGLHPVTGKTLKAITRTIIYHHAKGVKCE